MPNTEVGKRYKIIHNPNSKHSFRAITNAFAYEYIDWTKNEAVIKIEDDNDLSRLNLMIKRDFVSIEVA